MSGKERGFTLVEVLVAVAILSIALVPLLSVLNTNLAETGRVRDMRVASNLARAEMEKVKSLSLDESGIISDEYEKTVNSSVWKIKREVTETPGPLEIRVKIYRKDETKPVASLFTLRENLTWP